MTRRIIIETDPSEELSEFELNHIMELFKNLKNFEIEIKKRQISPSTPNNPIIIPYIPIDFPTHPPNPFWYWTTTNTGTDDNDITYRFTL